MGYIYARQIYAGHITINDVPAKYVQATKDAYYDLYGIHL